MSKKYTYIPLGLALLALNGCSSFQSNAPLIVRDEVLRSISVPSSNFSVGSYNATNWESHRGVILFYPTENRALCMGQKASMEMELIELELTTGKKWPLVSYPADKAIYMENCSFAFCSAFNRGQILELLLVTYDIARGSPKMEESETILDVFIVDPDKCQLAGSTIIGDRDLVYGHELDLHRQFVYEAVDNSTTNNLARQPGHKSFSKVLVADENMDGLTDLVVFTMNFESEKALHTKKSDFHLKEQRVAVMRFDPKKRVFSQPTTVNNKRLATFLTSILPELWPTWPVNEP